MTEEILNNSFQNKISNFIKKKLKYLITIAFFLILILFGYFFYKDVKKKNEIQVSADYTQASIQFNQKKIDEAKILLENVINKNHRFYSALALYFIIDNNLEKYFLKIINFFDQILTIKTIDKENLNLIKIKKAIFLLKLEKNEDEIIKILNPIINSDSVWRDMAIKLISDYFFYKNQKTKSNEYLELLNNKIKK